MIIRSNFNSLHYDFSWRNFSELTIIHSQTLQYCKQKLEIARFKNLTIGFTGQAYSKLDHFTNVHFKNPNTIKIKIKKGLHRPGIEPGPPPWQGEILPLDQRCFTYFSIKN